MLQSRILQVLLLFPIYQYKHDKNYLNYYSVTTYLNFWIVVILLKLTIFIINLPTVAHSHIYLHGSNAFSCKESSHNGLNFNYHSKLMCRHCHLLRAKLLVFITLELHNVTTIIYWLIRATISHLYNFVNESFLNYY